VSRGAGSDRHHSIGGDGDDDGGRCAVGQDGKRSPDAAMKSDDPLDGDWILVGRASDSRSALTETEAICRSAREGDISPRISNSLQVSAQPCV
jgi:hypothetical protein